MVIADRKSTRLNSSHTVIYTLSLHDALPILKSASGVPAGRTGICARRMRSPITPSFFKTGLDGHSRSEEHTSELQSHRDLHSFPTRRSSDLKERQRRPGGADGDLRPADAFADNAVFFQNRT